jgi:hypothetical protein
MEGPTPISALIHAATMVTAGIFMVARMSAVRLSDAALSFVTIIGATTALFMAFLGIITDDIKRVIACSTLSQLGYMTVALGVRLLGGHLPPDDAFFKALLFWPRVGDHRSASRAGLRRMGSLRKYMPITYWTTVIGSLFTGWHPPFAASSPGRDHRGGPAVDGDRAHLRAVGADARRVRDGAVQFSCCSSRSTARSASGIRRRRRPRGAGTTTMPRPVPAGKPMGSDRAADPAGDPVGLPAGRMSIRCYSAISSEVRSRSRRNTGMATLREMARRRHFIAHGLAEAPFWFAVAGIGSHGCSTFVARTCRQRSGGPRRCTRCSPATITSIVSTTGFSPGVSGAPVACFRDRRPLDRRILRQWQRAGGRRGIRCAAPDQSSYMYLYAFMMILGVHRPVLVGRAEGL